MRKVAETISQDAEDNCEILEEQVLEAQELAEVSNHKYEDAVRRYKMVQSENERTLERADEFERYRISKKNILTVCINYMTEYFIIIL